KETPPEVITTLMARMVQQSIQDGETSLNLGLVGNTLSGMWSNEQQTSYRCSHFPLLAPRSQLLRVNRWIQTPVSIPTAKKISKPGSQIGNSPVPQSATAMKPESCIEIAEDEPQDWAGTDDSRGVSSEDQPRFRIVG
ncbi:MAG TPA: hypothetical protein DCM07_01705, partial [Planctomycetaceae bacterium]|nr:hypothetical protein [Planctomycetaceae bacterium]